MVRRVKRQSSSVGTANSITVYCKLFEVEKFRGFRGLIGDRETFPAKHFPSSFKLECHGRTLQEENRTIYSWLFRTPLSLNKTDFTCPRGWHAVHRHCRNATLCDFQLDTILQPDCLAISAKLRKRQVKQYIQLFEIIKQICSINETAYVREHIFDPRGEQTAKVFQQI